MPTLCTYMVNTNVLKEKGKAQFAIARRAEVTRNVLLIANAAVAIFAGLAILTSLLTPGVGLVILIGTLVMLYPCAAAHHISQSALARLPLQLRYSGISL
jgi:hypothetical protein